MGLNFAEDIYSLNKVCLKDAVVIFGGGCTAEIVSPEGLVLTNHHCGYGSIQAHSSVDHDYLQDGFWAKSKEEELPNPNLSVTFLIRIEDVTTQILANVKPDMSETDRTTAINEARHQLRKKPPKEIIIGPVEASMVEIISISLSMRDIMMSVWLAHHLVHR